MSFEPVNLLWHLDNIKKPFNIYKASLALYNIPIGLQFLDQSCIRAFVRSEADLMVAKKLLATTLDLTNMNNSFYKPIYYKPPLHVEDTICDSTWIVTDLSGWDGETYKTVQIKMDPFSFDRSIKIQDMNLFDRKQVCCDSLISDKVYIGPDNLINEISFTNNSQCLSLGNLTSCKSLHLFDCNILEDASNLQEIVETLYIKGDTKIKEFPKLRGSTKNVELKNTNINVLCFKNPYWQSLTVNNEGIYNYGFLDTFTSVLYSHQKLVRIIRKSPLEELPLLIEQCRFQAERDMILYRLNGISIWPDE